VLTAQRSDEVSSAEWTKIDLAKQLWKIPTARTKSGREHEVPLSNLTIELLSSLPRFGPLVFSTASTGDRLISEFSNAKNSSHNGWRSLQDPLSRPVALMIYAALLAQAMAAAGTPPYIISKVLNHAEGGVTQIYDRFSYAKEKARALDAWASRLSAIL
jgi:integrase